MTPAFAYLWKWRGFGGLLLDAAEHDFAGFHVDLLGPKSSLQPNLGHDIVGGVVAPPGRIMGRVRRQLAADHPLDLRERHRNLVGPLRAQDLAQTAVLAHLGLQGETQY